MTQIKSDFSLADITDYGSFRQLGESLAADPTGRLRRTTLGARIIQGADGMRRTELVTTEAVDHVASAAPLLPREEARSTLIELVLSAPVVPARANQRYAAGEIVDAFLRGLGPSAETLLSSYLDRAAARLIQLITEEQRKVTTKPTYGEVIELTTFGKSRIGRPETTTDRHGDFKGKKGVAFEGYRKSLYAQDWFDSSPERDVANILEDEAAVTVWLRLQTGDLPILWTGAREYNPDFIAVDREDIRWIVEVKMDKELLSADVQGKREAARRWANHVSGDETVGTCWRYLLVSETDIKTAKGSWEALKALGVN